MRRVGCEHLLQPPQVGSGSGRLSQKLPTPVHYVAVEDEYGEVGPVDYLAERFGLTAEHIVEVAEKAVKG